MPGQQVAAPEPASRLQGCSSGEPTPELAPSGLLLLNDLELRQPVDGRSSTKRSLRSGDADVCFDATSFKGRQGKAQQVCGSRRIAWTALRIQQSIALI